ncbi:penicillin-binding transpeptidase domain-containing protein [Paenibacillus sp. HB172176]|uniref:peptidoglycan D,D-transpeptidase FtsI family protein n=1 Tax=Paenibacillus sp. HB172176 TaxID=2493690 RepID=UPI001F0E7E55|nr:penicillin-binding transpeptidase domain-containing protein [Paenibacillus sp. HB172176]
MIRKRALYMGTIISFVLLLFVARLIWLQLLPVNRGKVSEVTLRMTEDWKKLAVKQRGRSLMLDSGRGDFLDRCGRAITGETYQALALFPVHEDAGSDEAELTKLAELLHTKKGVLVKRLDSLKQPEFWRNGEHDPPIRLTEEQARQVGNLKLAGIRVLPYHNRYLSGFEPKHLIGFTSQHPEWLLDNKREQLLKGKRRLDEQVGGAGLEKSLDSLLHGVGETTATYFLDGRSEPLQGLDLRVTRPGNGNYPVKVRTTLDLALQNEIEDYVDREGLMEGAVVVLDTRNADIVAMVSRPKLKPGEFTSSDGSQWVNHALAAVEPGSIYKLVTAAAAYENRLADPHEAFECDGEYGKYGLSCWKTGGHGRLTMEDGLAQSCNLVFAEIAERIDQAAFERTAEALGVKNRIGWHTEKPFHLMGKPLRLLEEEEEGRLFANGAVDGGILAQSGIGQRDVRMSPLQAANLMVTLLHDGRVLQPRIVSEIDYANGQTLARLNTHYAAHLQGRISPRTASLLRKGMEAVVDHGTGQSIKGSRWRAAGKSGTAETTQGGIARNHQWFAGYGPLAKPRYAIAVLAANRKPHSTHQATRLFRGILDIAAASEASSSTAANSSSRS